MYTGFWSGNLRERDNVLDSGVDAKIILKWIFRTWGYELDDLAQDSGRWRALVNAAMNPRVP